MLFFYLYEMPCKSKIVEWSIIIAMRKDQFDKNEVSSWLQKGDLRLDLQEDTCHLKE
jgi:hypothetical protein